MSKGKQEKSDIIDKAAGERKNYRCIMYVQRLDYLDMDFDLNELKDVLNEELPYPDYQWAYIVHDKDYDDALHEDVQAPHLHVTIYNSSSVKLEKLREIFNEPTNNYFEFMRNKDAGFLYLTHNTKNAIRDGKYVYSEDEVIANFDYSDYLAKRISDERSDDLEILIDKIGLGEITYDDLLDDPKLYKLYLRHSVELRRALDVRAEKVEKQIRSGEVKPKKSKPSG